MAVENKDRQTEIATCQNLVTVGSENITLQQNNPRCPKRKRDGENKGSREAQLETIRIQTTKAAMKKVKTATEKAQSTKVKKVTTIRDNTKRLLTKKRENSTSKKGKLTGTQEDEGCTKSPN